MIITSNISAVQPRGWTKPQVNIIDWPSRRFAVSSKSRPGRSHTVTLWREQGANHAFCTCEAGEFNRVCRHIRAVTFLYRAVVKAQRAASEVAR